MFSLKEALGFFIKTAFSSFNLFNFSIFLYKDYSLYNHATSSKSLILEKERNRVPSPLTCLNISSSALRRASSACLRPLSSASLNRLCRSASIAKAWILLSSWIRKYDLERHFFLDQLANSANSCWHTDTHTHTHMRTLIHTSTHTNAHTHTHTHTHTHNTRAHTRTCACAQILIHEPEGEQALCSRSPMFVRAQRLAHPQPPHELQLQSLARGVLVPAWPGPVSVLHSLRAVCQPGRSTRKQLWRREACKSCMNSQWSHMVSGRFDSWFRIFYSKFLICNISKLMFPILLWFIHNGTKLRYHLHYDRALCMLSQAYLQGMRCSQLPDQLEASFLSFKHLWAQRDHDYHL